MEVSTDYGDMTKLILFSAGENPLALVPENWEVVERTEPEMFRGMENPGRVVCRLTKRPPDVRQAGQ